MKTLLLSKTVWGAVLASASYVLAQPHIDWHIVLQGVGAVLSAVGVRDAIAKASQ